MVNAKEDIYGIIDLETYILHKIPYTKNCKIDEWNIYNIKKREEFLIPIKTNIFKTCPYCCL